MHNVYRGISAKNFSIDKRGQSDTRVHLQILERKMLSNQEWLAFFRNIKNKQHLLNLFVTYLCADNFVKSSLLPTLANKENEIFKISSSVKKVFECNHEGGNTRIIFHGLQQNTDVAVCLKYTNVLVLLVFAYDLTE